jgi:D-alanyl-D-alanine endopeptidase (penicillin-binding protein 7)
MAIDTSTGTGFGTAERAVALSDAKEYAGGSFDASGAHQMALRPTDSLLQCRHQSHNTLFPAGLPVTQTRLVRNAQLICVLGAFVATGLATPLLAQTTVPRGPSQPQPRLTLAETTGAKAPGSVAKAPAKKKKRSAAARRRARAAAQARLLKEAQEPKFKLDESGTLVPDLRAEAAIIYNPENGQVLWEENSQNQRSIASITKIMTAAVFLEDSPDLSEQVVIQRADVRHASTTYLRAGYTVTTDDLLHLLLIASDNAAARALARVSSYGPEGFIVRMNEMAAELGLTNTQYADPSGLLAANVSSAYDMARLIAYVAADHRIAAIMQKQHHTIAAGRRTISINSTNQLVMKGDVDVLGGKTGFIRKAGYCLATLLRLPEGGPQVAVVVLGAKSNAGRFWETRHLFNWLSSKARDLFGAPVEAAAVGVVPVEPMPAAAVPVDAAAPASN